MNILVINCGSSSLKYQLIDMTNETVTAKGLCERIGIEGSNLVHQPAGMGKLRFEKPMPDHKVAIQMVLDALVDPEHGVVKSVDEISAVGHRVVHAGTNYSDAVVIDENAIPSDTVSIGSKVKVYDEEFEEEIEYSIVGSMEANPREFKISDKSPVGTALLGAKVGDVVAVEPILPENPLLTAPNCILTPHMAWAPTESRQRILNTVEENIKGYLSGSPINKVN